MKYIYGIICSINCFGHPLYVSYKLLKIVIIFVWIVFKNDFDSSLKLCLLKVRKPLSFSNMEKKKNRKC